MSEDVRIKNDKFSFHYRVAGLIEQNGKFLIQKIDGMIIIFYLEDMLSLAKVQQLL